MKMIRVIIAEDLETIREGLKLLLEQDKDIEVVACAENGKEAFLLCKNLLPDIVLMDLQMPVCDGVAGTRLIKSEFGSIKVLVLSGFSDTDEIYKALKNGADGYVHKDIKPLELIQLIKSIVGGVKIVHPNVFFNEMKRLEENEEAYNDLIQTSEENNVSFNITVREKSVIELIIKGKTNKQISQTLFISEGRVKNIITNILEKLKQKDRTQLAVFAVKNNIV